MNNFSQTLIFIVFVMAYTLISRASFAFRIQGARTKSLTRELPPVWKRLHGFCLPAGAYFALFTFQVLTGGFNVRGQLL